MRSKRARKIHRHAQRIHFGRRAEERLGYALNVEEVIHIRELVRTETAELLFKPNLRFSMWRVPVKSGTIIVVYDHETKELVTVLSEAMWEERLRKTNNV